MLIQWSPNFPSWLEEKNHHVSSVALLIVFVNLYYRIMIIDLIQSLPLEPLCRLIKQIQGKFTEPPRRPYRMPPCFLSTITNALGHVTVEERLFRIRPELGPRGNPTVTTPNGVFSMHHLCTCTVYGSMLICACALHTFTFAFVCNVDALARLLALAELDVSEQFWEEGVGSFKQVAIFRERNCQCRNIVYA